MTLRIQIRIVALCGAAALMGAESVGPFDDHGDVGVTPLKGKIEVAGPELRITGGGANVWAAVDAFHFAWKRMTGDVALTADVHFIGAGTVPHRKILLMMRQSLDPGSPYADVALHGDSTASLQYRPTEGGQTLEVKQESKADLSGPVRLRIERRGNTFTIQTGKPGETPITTGPATVLLTGPVYVGLGVCAHDANILETAVFTNVSVQALPPRAPQFRSKITIFNLRSKSTRTLYEADTIWEAPNWSPDGKYLVSNSGGRLYRISVAGTGKNEPEAIPIDPTYRLNNDHSPSPDGKLLAFSASSPGSRQSQVYVANADGTGVRLMVSAAPSYFHGWSPDGKYLALLTQHPGANGGPANYDLFRVPVTGGEAQQLTSNNAYDDGPDYSPDGKWIYFNSDRSGGWDIWRMPADGAGDGDAKAERVTSDDLEDWFAHFSPDGRQMLVFDFPKGTENHNGKMEGVLLRIAPTPAARLSPPKFQTLITFFGGQGTINVNSWSPDSKKFAFVQYEPLP